MHRWRGSWKNASRIAALHIRFRHSFCYFFIVSLLSLLSWVNKDVEKTQRKFLLDQFHFRYGIAVAYNHVPAFIPYISDTGVFVPERSVFSLLVNFSAFLHGFIIYLRYENIFYETKASNRRKLRFLNKFCLILGLSCSFGLCLIANFQVIKTWLEKKSVLQHIYQYEKIG